MTDRIDTNQDLQMTLAQIEDTLAKAADPAALFDGAKAHLGALYNQAEAAGNDAAMTAINESWGHVQSLAAAAQQNREAYLTAKDIAGTFQTQRDDVMKEHEELVHAIEYMDTDHALVSDLIESVEEAINEEQSYYWDDQFQESVFNQLQDVLRYDDEYELHINILNDVLAANLEVSPARQRELYAWLDAVKADNEAGDDDDE